MRIQKIILIAVITQLSVACIATPYVPTKSQPPTKGVAPPKSSPGDDVQITSCKYQFKKEQSLEEIANLAAQMQQDCGLSEKQILTMAQKEFESQ